MKSQLSLALVLCAAFFFGCSNEKNSNRPKVVRTSGVVRYLGKPVAAAEVSFINDGAGRTGFAVTDKEGRFRLTTFNDGDGVVPGPQRVAIRRVDVHDPTPANVDVTAGGRGLPLQIKWIVPEKYSDPSKSGLTVTVVEGGPNDFTFDLN